MTTPPIYVELAIPANLNQVYVYKLQLGMEHAKVGGVVYVNFNNRYVHAVITALNVQPNYDPAKIKAVHSLVNPCYFSAELFSVLQFAANYFIASPGTTLYTALPPLYRGTLPKPESTSYIEFTLATPVYELLEQFWALQPNLEMHLGKYKVSQFLSSTIDLSYIDLEALVTLEFIQEFSAHWQATYQELINVQESKNFKSALKQAGLTLVTWRLLYNIIGYTLLAKLLKLQLQQKVIAQILNSNVSNISN
ncbi:hypothetical protein, partial [Psittacicella hinzii]